MIDKENFMNLDLKNVEGPGTPGWKIDMYSHFKRLEILKETSPMLMINLNQYYTVKEGFATDKVDSVIKDLQRVRFFNRFDRETLYQALKMTDLRTIGKDSLLFLEDDESAIIVNGNLYCFTHKDDVSTPSLQAIFNPGDIIGNSKIDGGWSRETHSWIIAYNNCDILVMKTAYVDFLWDKMKESHIVKLIATRLQSSTSFKNISEQSIYTLAYDMIQYKRYGRGELICPQYTKSQYNLLYLKKEKDTFEKFTSQMKGDVNYQDALKIF